MSGFEKIWNAKNHFWFILIRENEILCFFGASLEACFWIENFNTRQILI